MSRKSKAVYFVHTAATAWGPVPWDALREWLGLKWLPAEILVRENEANDALPARDVPRLWTIAGRRFVAEDVSGQMASGKVSMTPALSRYLTTELGWPGDPSGLNYYNGDKLRKQLEELFPIPSRPPLDDPDWPECWGGSRNCPAAVLRANEEHDNRPATERQCAVLTFFGHPQSGWTHKTASPEIERLLAIPENKARWEKYKETDFSATPATEAQLFRLDYAAKRLRKTYDRTLSKYAAKQLIDEWYGGNDPLEDAYREHKDATDMQEIEAEIEAIQREDAAEEEEDLKNVAPRRIQPASQRSPEIPASLQKQGCLGILVVGGLITIAGTAYLLT